MSKKTVYLTGGTGFIGQRFMRSWLAKSADNHLIVQTRFPDRCKSVQKNDGDFARVHFVSSLLELPKNIQEYTLINLAGAPIADARWTKARKALLVQSRVELTETLFNHAVKVAMPQRVISASAIGFYGLGDADCSEVSAPGVGFAADLCRQWERAALRFEVQVPVLRFRLGVVLGAGGGVLKKLLPLYRLGLGGPIGSGAQWFSWIHLDDVVAALMMAIDQEDLRGAVNFVSPNPVRQRDFARTLAGALNRPAFIPTPASVLRLIYGEMAEELLLGGQRVVPSVLMRRGFDFAYPRLDAALANIISGEP